MYWKSNNTLKIEPNFKPVKVLMSRDVWCSAYKYCFLQDEDTPRADRMPPVEPSQPARLSPNSLEQKFYSAFNNLESMEMSIKQLTSVDKTRAVALAQQETVSLAQILKVTKLCV